MRKRRHSSRSRASKDVKMRVIKSQHDEIESLKRKIEALNIDLDKKDELIHSVDDLREQLRQIVSNVRKKEQECDKLLKDMRLMHDALDREVFKNRWWIVKRLIKA